MAKRTPQKVIYTEPDDYFPKEIRDMFKEKKTTKKTVKTATKKDDKKK